MALTRANVEGTLLTVLAKVPEAELRLVGTASCLLRGIELPAGDIDVLFRDRHGVDAWISSLRVDHEVETAPTWEPDTNQYFARLSVADVTVELSTVEVETESDTAECFGEGPWQHFDLVPCGGHKVAVVANELRLITELARGREDRYRPIIEFLRTAGWDERLLRRGLANVGTSEPAVERLLGQLQSNGAVQGA